MVTKHIYSYRHFLKMIAMKNGKQVGIGSTIEFLLGIFRHSSVQVVWRKQYLAAVQYILKVKFIPEVSVKKI